MASQFTQHASTSAISLLASSSTHDVVSLTDKYSLSASPASWGLPVYMTTPEPDDALHNPDPRRDRKSDMGGSLFTGRGLANLGCLFILAAGVLMLFAGYPILSHFLTKLQTTQGGFNLGGINATGQIPDMPGNFGLIDRETPKDVYTKPSYMDPNQQLTLVFSDEFNVDGRSFYPGDDPYWEAVDLHYWGTNDLEWYDPGQVTTQGGALRIKIEEVADPTNNHNLKYRSAMIQSWNKFCFTGGLIEAAITLPGSNNVVGFWPAVWMMGNLGRAGYGASTDGMWPYTYDACDVGTFPNQTYPGTNTPLLATTNGDPNNNNQLSYQPGQRLSACTCPGESHPGPVRSNGSYVGRAAPEIDITETLISGGVGKSSMSAQWAPYNAEYQWLNTTNNYAIYDPQQTILNPYQGGAYQQATSTLVTNNQSCYELSQGCFAVYGFQYQPGFDNAYITWINDGQKAWTLYSGAVAADPRVEISARPVPQEPMYIIANLGFSLNFGGIDLQRITFPATMSIDYVRVYQPQNAINIGCDPKDFPTAAYIQTYQEAYTNPNLTTWKDYGQPVPKNRLLQTC